MTIHNMNCPECDADIDTPNNFDEEGLGDEFFTKSGSKITIPVYQRGFDWNKDHLEALWNDILEHDRDNKNFINEHHFFGFIWTQDNKGHTKAKPRISIVDGQQRLTATTLLLIAIRDFCFKRKHMEKHLDNLFTLYVDMRCPNCNRKKLYFRPGFDKDGKIIHDKEDPNYPKINDKKITVACEFCSERTDITTKKDDNKTPYNSENYLKEKRYLDDKKQPIAIDLNDQFTPNDKFVEKNIDAIQDLLYVYDKVRGELDFTTPKINLGSINDSFFLKTIYPIGLPSEKITKMKSMRQNLSDTNSKLGKAYEYLLGFLEDRINSDEETVQDFYGGLDRKMNVLLTNFQFIRIPVKNEKQAYRRFDTINNRGSGLKNQDLIKTRIFAVLYDRVYDNKAAYNDAERHDKMKKLEEKWSEMRNRITKPVDADYEFEKFLHHYLVISQDSKIKKGEIFDKVSDMLDEGHDPEELINDLSEWSEDFVKIRTANDNDWKNSASTVFYLRSVKSTESTICYHIILAAYYKFWKKNDEKGFTKIVKLALRNFIRNKTICETPQNAFEDLYKECAKEIYDGNFTAEKLKNKFIDKKSPYETDDKLKTSLNEQSNWYKKKITKYLLHEINFSFNGTGYTPNRKAETEHIMPQHQTQDWTDYLTGQGISNLKNYYSKYLNELGNLTLLSSELNKEIRDGLYNEKLKGRKSNPTEHCYEKEVGNLVTSKLSDLSKKDWTEKQIIKRSKILMFGILAILDIKNIDAKIDFDYKTTPQAKWYNCLDR